MELKILGPFEVYDASGARIGIPAGRERALLVALLLRRGEVVSVDALVDALWGERPPSTAGKAIQGYVSHLRRLLGPDAGQALVTQSPGYVLRVAHTQIDAARFERLAEHGQRALEDGDPAGALGALESALSLWRGPALAEFAFDDFAQREIQRLTERQLETIEDRAEALLRLGRHNGVVSELETLVSEHPLRERLRAQLMLALYRSGRTADALQAYKEGARLSRELGIDPPAELKRLERAILDQDPAIAAPPRAPETDGAREERRDSLAQRSEQPPAKPPGGRRWRTLLAGSVATLVVVALGAFVVDRVRSEPASVTVVPPAVAVVDPATNRVVTSITVGSKPVTIAAGEGSIWVGDARDGTVTRIDPATLATKAIGIGAPAVDVAVGAGGVWVATGGFGTVVRVDAELESVADSIELGARNDPVVPAASAVAAGAEGVWVGAFDGLVRLHPRTGRELGRVDLGRTPALQVAVGGGAVWSTTIANRAKRVEASSAQVTAEFYAGLPMFPIAVAANGVLVGGGPWTGADRGQLWKVHRVTGSQELSARLPGWPAGIAPDRDAIWVTVPQRDALVRIDARTGETSATIPLGGPPEEVVVADGRVWVIVARDEPEG